mmetsp:Transcript_4116/g.9340  ORF Transcript_4116/g.9340 Transcript_4116/m.9340 type:complete len:221 (-) Transcript_4116:1223-1885(-)
MASVSKNSASAAAAMADAVSTDSSYSSSVANSSTSCSAIATASSSSRNESGPLRDSSTISSMPHTALPTSSSMALIASVSFFESPIPPAAPAAAWVDTVSLRPTPCNISAAPGAVSASAAILSSSIFATISSSYITSSSPTSSAIASLSARIRSASFRSSISSTSATVYPRNGSTYSSILPFCSICAENGSFSNPLNHRTDPELLSAIRVSMQSGSSPLP